MLIVIDSSGLVHSVFTVTGTSTAGPNSTVQVRVTLGYSKDSIGLTGSLIMVTEFGGGTKVNRKPIQMSKLDNYYNYTYFEV